MPRRLIEPPFDPVILEENPSEKSYRETVDDIMRAFEASEEDHDWEIRVFLVRGPAKKGFKQPWLFNCSPEDLPIDERLSKEYGEGLYRCSVYHNGQLMKGFHREIGPAPKSANQSAQDKSDLGLLIETIRAENQRSNEMFGQILARLAQPAPVAPAVNPMDMVVSMVTALKGLNDLAPKPAAAEGSSAKDLIEVFKSGIELAQNAAGGGGETGIGDIVKALIQSPVIENVLKQGQGHSPQIPLDYAPIPPNYGPNLQPIAQPQPQGPQMSPPVLPADPSKMTPQQIDMLVRAQLGFLLGCAKSGRDPQLYAEVILDQMPEPALEHILTAPDIIAELVAINPEIATVRHWFDCLLVEIRQMAQTDAAESDATATPGPRNGAGIGGGAAQ